MNIKKGFQRKGKGIGLTKAKLLHAKEKAGLEPEALALPDSFQAKLQITN